jgi:hypothetical protein
MRYQTTRYEDYSRLDDEGVVVEDVDPDPAPDPVLVPETGEPDFDGFVNKVG